MRHRVPGSSLIFVSYGTSSLMLRVAPFWIRVEKKIGYFKRVVKQQEAESERMPLIAAEYSLLPWVAGVEFAHPQ
jgi:hypothetical protein